MGAEGEGRQKGGQRGKEHVCCVHQAPPNAKADPAYKCSGYAKSFSCRTHLTYHQMTHIGENPYKGSVCRKCFS